MKQAIASEVTKSAPPVALSIAATVGGLTLNEWMAIATIAYIGLQAGFLVWKWWKEFRAKQ